MYEEVRLLREELNTITAIYAAQKTVIDRSLLLRESPKTKLDSRINKRTLTFLDDMIKHFSTLCTYAEEAETLVSSDQDPSSLMRHILTGDLIDD